MILGVGLDIVEIKRINESLENFGKKFEKRVFTNSEIEKSQKITNIDKKVSFFAKRFAAKEAFSKATGLGIGEAFSFNDINIVNDAKGKPEIEISSKIREDLKKHFNIADFKIDLSLSDEREIAQAIVIISKKNDCC